MKKIRSIKEIPTYTANLAAIKLKALARGQSIIAPVSKTYRKIIKASDLDKSILDCLFNREVDLDELKGFTFEVKKLKNQPRLLLNVLT